jgi:hypothetical protein
VEKVNAKKIDLPPLSGSGDLKAEEKFYLKPGGRSLILHFFKTSKSKT